MIWHQSVESWPTKLIKFKVYMSASSMILMLKVKGCWQQAKLGQHAKWILDHGYAHIKLLKQRRTHLALFGYFGMLNRLVLVACSMSQRVHYSTIMSFYHIRSREHAQHRAVIHCRVRMQKEQLWLTESGCFGYFYYKIEAKITIFFCSKIINLSFNGLANNMREHFAHC